VEGPFPFRFDVLLEGREVLSDYSPGELGVVDSRRFNMDVTGGGLEIELRSRTRAYPHIAAIEVRRP
jgi:hypothetical protein